MNESTPLISKSPPPKVNPHKKRPPLISVPSNQSFRNLTANETIFESFITNASDIDESSIIDFFQDTHKQLNKSSLNSFDYISYYCPILKWLPNYKFKQNFVGDFLAGISLSSFQIPLVMSIATSLAHLSPMIGLYSIVIGALTYSVFGSIPTLIVGPAPSTALIYGTTIELVRSTNAELGSFSKLEISSCISFGLSGVLLASGIFRLGFLDNVLSRSLLKGFIGAMGLIMIANELAIELGIHELSLKHPHLTTLDKLLFVFKYYPKSHITTTLISSITLCVVMTVRVFKQTMINKYNKKSFIYIPELLLMVIIGTCLSYVFDWEGKGVTIIGDVTTLSVTTASTIINPIGLSKFAIYRKIFQTSFLCTILGYIDSITASKSLSTKYNYSFSSNRELVALGLTNFFVSLIGGLPCFGALGRSKINILSGASSSMSLIVMAITVLIAIKYLLVYLFYLPECILALSTTIIGITVLEEVPQDLKFFWNIGAFDEIMIFSLIFSLTCLWSAESGIFLGIIIAVIRVIKHSTKSNIQILGRIPHTNIFRNADELIEESFNHFTDNDNASTSSFSNLINEIEDIEGILIIRIPENLNFANIGDLKNRLTRIERYGSLLVHPSQPPTLSKNKDFKFIIFDCKGMGKIDNSAIQVLYEILLNYVEVNNIKICFSRISINKPLRTLLRKSGIKSLINKNFNVTNSHVNQSSDLGNGFFLSIEDALRAIDLIA